MNKLAFLTVLAIGFVLPAICGCKGEENTVIEAPPAVVDEEPALDGMSDEEYDAAMDAEMSGQ